MVGTARRVRASRSWYEPLSNWTATVGFSGTGKTPGLDVSRRALSLIARNRKHKLGELQRAHERRVETAKAAAKKWKAEVQEAVEAGKKAPDMPAQAVLPGEFVAPQLYVSNVTIERLVSLVQAKPRGALMIGDELAGLFLNMGRYSNGSDKEFWLEAWNGGSYVQERQSRPPVAVDYLLVGMTGGFQPDKLARSFAGDDDGMYARVLFAWPPAPNFQPLSNAVADVEPEFQTALMRLIDLRDMEDKTFVPKDVPLSDKATEVFEHFRKFLYAGRLHSKAASGNGGRRVPPTFCAWRAHLPFSIGPCPASRRRPTAGATRSKKSCNRRTSRPRFEVSSWQPPSSSGVTTSGHTPAQRCARSGSPTTTPMPAACCVGPKRIAKTRFLSSTFAAMP